MECDEEEDANSLLSLSQTFLQPDSSSSSMGLSTNQIHNWSALATSAADVAAQFSPISPADSYNTNTTSGHALMDNDTNLRFYSSRSATSQSATRSTIPSLFNRSGNSGISSVSNLNSFPSASRVGGNDFNHNSGHVNLDTSTNMCYEQPCNLRPASSIYGEKDSSYSNRGLNGSSNSHTIDASNVIANSFAHTGYSDDQGMLSLTPATDDDGKLGNRSVHLEQKMFDSRLKQKEYNKDFSNLYGHTFEKPLQSTEITMSFDRRDASNFDSSFDRRDASNFDSSFEFSSDSRDFTSARLDVASVNRAAQDQNYHQSQKYSTAQVGESDMLSNTLSLDSKRVPSSYVNFGLGGHIEDNYGRLNNSQKKSSFGQQLSDLPPDLEPVFHGYHTDFGGHHKLLLDSHRNFEANEFQDNEDTSRFNLKDQTNTRDISNKWSGRPRAHRKMARLLGSEDHRDYSQVINTSNSNKSTFSKGVPSLETVSQDKHSFQPNVQRDQTANARTFLTMEEELDLRTNHHQQRSFVARRDDILDRTQTSQRELGLLQTTSTFTFDSSAMTSMHKDTTSSILASQQFLPTTQLDLDFHATLSVSQPQKDLDLNQHFGLQVSKDFGLETSHSASNQEDLSFDHSGDPQHISQPDITLPDNLGIVSQVQSELSFEAYFNSASDRDFNSASDRDFNCTSERDFMFCRKFSSSTSRDLNYVPSTAVNDFNIDDYMNPQRDLSQSYFSRPDLPQDMTLYQKTSSDKSTIPETSTSFKGRDKSQGLTTDKDKQGEISELQKELTKTSTKESMKGIRIPRDINRAMEILQGLQEDEREEERRKELQQKQQQHLQGLISSPKKTFQSKHNVESLSLTDQQFLGSSGNFMEDQSVGSFLDHPHLTMAEQPQDSLQMVQSYQAFPQINQSIEVEMVSTLPNKRDLQQNLAHNVTSELDYHILKRLACSTSMKGMTKTQSSSFANNSTNLASILADNSTHDLGMQFPVTGIHFQTQQPDLEEVVSNSLLNNNSNSTLELNRSKNELAFMDFEPQQSQHASNEKPQNAASDQQHHSSMEIPQVIRCKQEAEALVLSRKNLYDMMKREQFCDAVLSTSKQTVKVHQVVLCSMSQYLTTLLHKMKQAVSSSTTKGITPPSSYPTSTPARNHSILLVVNCDGIKSSSMMTFLLYIYLGRAELSESNVLDMYMLACSLRVQTLKDLCKDFMWVAHISSEQLKVPQLLVSSQRLETQDQATMTEMSTDDKSTNTPCCVRGMEVSTQTDRSTSEAGGGGQEEWVMLKKTKQKTVSPSKSRLIGKSLTCIDSPGGCKTGKKGWLSPKRRYKTENQIEVKVIDKEAGAAGKEIPISAPTAFVAPASESLGQLDITQNHCSYSAVSEAETNDNLCELLSPNVEMSEKAIQEKTSLPGNKQSLAFKKATRTTVEIAAAAAAAKLAAHSYGTRTARGIAKGPISYASLAYGLERKKSVTNPKEKTAVTMSKKKDFIKSNPGTEFFSQDEVHLSSKSDQFTFMLKDNLLESSSVCAGAVNSETVAENVGVHTGQLKADGGIFKLSVKQPFKKSIVHRSRSEDVLNKNYAQLVSNLPVRADVNTGSENDFMDSDLLDSIVNTMKCENSEVDIQKAINDFDSLLTTASSSVSSTSLTSPLKSPTVLLSTPDSSSPLKSRSTPQGFRKRLIHQINSEKNGPSSPQCIPSQNGQAVTNTRSLDHFAVFPFTTASTSVSTAASPSLVSSTTHPSALVTFSPEEIPQNMLTYDQLSVNYKQIADSLPASISVSNKDQLPPNVTESVDELALSLYSLGEEPDLVLDSKACSFSSMTDIDLGLKGDNGQQFSHKIFKRKRRSKARKSSAADSDAKIKAKKVQLSGDIEGGVVKSRLRKAIGSDSEGGTGRTKQKKNVPTENEGALAKVRPPPKKRAKMELELLQVVNPEKNRGSGGDHAKCESVELGSEGRRKSEGENSKMSDSRSSANLSPSDGVKESLQFDGQVKVKKPVDGVKSKPQRIPQTQIADAQLSELETETKLTLMLKELSETKNLNTRQFSCKLCQTKFRSARRTIRHMGSHGLPQEDALKNIAIEEKESNQEACDVCGYRTKDQRYHYMHIHKYFKHGVPLPLGWSTDKCEVCGKECFNKFQLKEHMMSHDESHCFICRQCGQSFKMRNGLNSHVFHKHSDIRKHECKVCKKSFKTWTHLKVHVRSHTGERPFACIDCGHRSTTQGNMRLHLSTHGYSKDVIHGLMEQICKSVQEINPEALEEVMLNLAQKPKDEQTALKEKKKSKRPDKNTTDLDAQMKPENESQIKDIPDGNRKTRARKSSKGQKTTSVSKFAGSQIERLLTQPLSELKPPKFILPQPSQQPLILMSSNSSGNEESAHSQMLCDSTDSGLGALSMLLQQQTQKQESSGMFLLPLPQADQRQHQQHQQRLQQQATSTVSSMMGYAVIPTYVLSGQNSAESALDPSSCLALPVFSISDVLSSGLNLVHSGVQSMQLVPADGVYPAMSSSSIMQSSQDSDAASFLNSPHGQELLQVNSVAGLQYPDSKILVTNSMKQDMSAENFSTLMSSSGTTIGTTTIMVLPNVKTTSSQSQQMHHEVPTIFSYPPLLSSNQSVLLPDVQMTSSSLDTNSFMSFSTTVAAPEEVVSIEMSHQAIGNLTDDTENMLMGSHNDIATSTVNVTIDGNDTNSGIVAYTVVKCDSDSHVEDDGQILDTSGCVDNLNSFH